MLKRIIKAVTVAVVISCLVVCMLPTYAFADPVSATIMANAFAQAIAAYGASNGVAMTFDVNNSSNIGENVHELWKSFREGTQGVDDYATLAAAIFPELYYKAAVAVGAASDVYTVGVHIDDTYAEEFDNFYNWLLSGPAEMVQVDNQYYEFSSAQVGPSSVPIQVISVNDYNFGIVPAFSSFSNSLYSQSLPLYFDSTYNEVRALFYGSTSSPGFAYCYSDSSNRYIVLASTVRCSYGYLGLLNNEVTGTGGGSFSSQSSQYPGYYLAGRTIPLSAPFYVPEYPTFEDGMDVLIGEVADPPTSSIGVKSYDDAGIADIPDTTDPNYDALNRAKDIPLNIPWDDALYGDGTGALTDAQTSSIASDVDLSLVEEGVIELVAENDTPAPNPGEVYIPFLPVTLPNFNFNLSGIWHYVREWVTSLGAWFGVMFTIWNTLPYAMIVPVYATAVVVIVLGVYKRFFM